MKRILFAGIFLSVTSLAIGQGAQQKPEVSKEYRATADKVNDLVHTRIDAKFDYSKSRLNGKVWITLRPHFYPTDSLSLDAKGMDIHQVAIVKNGKNTPLQYDYDGMITRIHLDKT